MTRQQVEEFIVQMCHNFPDPVPSIACDDEMCYCIGGAFLMTERGIISATKVEWTTRFPDPGCIAEVLHAMNPALTEEDAFCYADDIICNNESEDFLGAEYIIRKALLHGSDTA